MPEYCAFVRRCPRDRQNGGPSVVPTDRQVIDFTAWQGLARFLLFSG
jgi:hypothetical protein